VEAEVVYALYGRDEDFQALVQAGVDINGSVVLARYGRIFR
jgi:N-acetylated-alpha-linked acidic dipeptidase